MNLKEKYRSALGSLGILENDKPRYGIFRSWIILLFVVFMILNVVVFVSYQRSHPGEGMWKHIWGYASSDAFKVLTTSLLLPIFLLALENHFNISGIIQERIQSEKQKRLEGRWECVQKTIRMWNDLNNLTSEIVYYKKGAKNTKQSNEESEKKIDTMLLNIENFDNSANEIVNMWLFRFPNLTTDDMDLFLTFINVLIKSAVTVAQHIRVIDDDDEICELQDSLGVIQDGIRRIVYHPILVILKLSIDLLSEDLFKTEESEIKESIKTWIDHLKIWAVEVKRLERTYDEFLSYIDGDEVEEFRAQVKVYEEWRVDNIGERRKNWPHWDDLKILFWNIQHENVCDAVKVPYSLSYIEHLADWLAFYEVMQIIDDRAKFHKVM